MNNGYVEFEKTLDLEASLPKLLSNDLSAGSLNSGNAFPVEGVTEGMPCLRVDERILYVYQDYKQRPTLKFDADWNVTTNALEQLSQDIIDVCNEVTE